MVNTYSTGISIQALGRPFAVVPRMFWTLVGFIAYTIAGVSFTHTVSSEFLSYADSSKDRGTRTFLRHPIQLLIHSQLLDSIFHGDHPRGAFHL